jgi:hypothetical protein
MKAIFIPHALYMEFLARKESLLKFLSVSSLTDTLSPPDVAFYIRCNQMPEVCLPDAIAKSFEFVDYSKDLKHLNIGGLETAIFERLENLVVNGIGGQLKEEKDKLLTCDILDGDVILFTYIDPPEHSSQGGGLVELYDRLIAQLSALIPFNESAKLPIFKAYLEAKQDETFKR